MRRCEVWWTAAGLPGAGRKRRPVVIVSHDVFNANERYPKVLLVHLTTTRRQGGPFEWEVEVRRGVAGLPESSTIKCAEVYTLLKVALDERIGTLPQGVVQRVDRALTVALGLAVDT